MVATPNQLQHTKLQANRFTVIDASDEGLDDPRQLFLLEAMGDQLIIEEDKFRTGYECKTCDGDGYTNDPCPMCVKRNRPKGYEEVGDTEPTRCRICTRERGTFGLVIGRGCNTCPDCNGLGATVVIPQTSEKRPTSGVLRSMGPECLPCTHCVTKVRLESGEVIFQVQYKWLHEKKVDIDCDVCKNTRKRLQVGNRVLYAVFSGTAINFKQKGVVRLMHENEIMARIWGGANLGEIVK